MPAASLSGAVLLLASDTVARLLLAPHVLPVAVLTAFLSTSTSFFYLLIRGRRAAFLEGQN